MDYFMFLAGGIGIGPALLLMYFTLSKYTYPAVERPFFDDRKVFMLLTVGFVIGVVMATFQVLLPLSELLVLVAYSILLELVMLVVLMLKRFALRVDTTFYGTALGLGVGATMAFSFSYRFFNAYTVEGSAIPIEAFAIIMVWSMQLVLLIASTGTLLGIGSARGRPWYFFAQAVMIQITYFLLLQPIYQGDTGLFAYIMFVIATVFAVMAYWYIHSKAIPEIVREAISRMKKPSKR
ncbi:MAG TPA: hypothetical protein VLH13_02020 [Methanomassiliicoccales archaeon]|nr:hypothetical protein [Methanomassiliicoccales archaeon]